VIGDIPVHQWEALTEEELRAWAAQYVGWATDEMSDPEDLSWVLEHQFPTSEFLSMTTDWNEYFEDDVRGNPRYGEDFEDADWHTPVVISIEHEEIIIWDGWHRIATSVARGDECIMTIKGRKVLPHS
jgi:hypothetical protein